MTDSQKNVVHLFCAQYATDMKQMQGDPKSALNLTWSKTLTGHKVIAAMLKIPRQWTIKFAQNKHTSLWRLSEDQQPIGNMNLTTYWLCLQFLAFPQGLWPSPLQICIGQKWLELSQFAQYKTFWQGKNTKNANQRKYQFVEKVMLLLANKCLRTESNTSFKIVYSMKIILLEK